MNTELFYKYMREYNEDELFYRDYYQAGKSPETLEEFLNGLDREKMHRKKRIITEFPETVPHFFADDEYFGEDIPRTIFLTKHNRYTPLFFHSHVFFELVYVVNGICENHIHDQTSLLKEGDLCLIAPSVNHSLGVFDDSLVLDILIRRSTLEHIFFNLLRDKDILGTFFLNSLYGKNYSAFITFHTFGDKEVRTSLAEMYFEQFQQDSFFDEIISNMLAIFLVKIVRKYKKTMDFSNKGLAEEDSVTILHYINNHYQTATLSELAEMLGYSMAYCSTYIKKVTGFKFATLLGQTRIRQARYLLSTTKMSVADISDSVGYENPENFIRAFKKEMQVTPTQYRNLRRIL